MKKNKGFTLIELLAVIVILAIIMLIAIPAVLNTMESAKRKSFSTYIDKLNKTAVERLVSDNILDKPTPEGCYIYNIKTDLNLSSTGDYKGYILISTTNNNPKYYFSIWNDDYMLIAYVNANYIITPTLLKVAVGSSDFKAFSNANQLDKLLALYKALLEETETFESGRSRREGNTTGRWQVSSARITEHGENKSRT